MFDSYAKKARPFVGVCAFIAIIGLVLLSTRYHIYAQESVDVTLEEVESENVSLEEVEPEDVPLEEVESVAESELPEPASPVIETPRTDESPISPTETVPVTDTPPVVISDVDAITNDSPISSEENQEVGEPVVSEELTPPPVVQVSSSTLIRTSERVDFSPNEPIVFTFTATQPFTLDPADVPATMEEDSFTDNVIEVFTSVTDTVVDSLSSIAGVIEDSVTDTFNFIMGDTEEYIAPEVQEDVSEQSSPEEEITSAQEGSHEGSQEEPEEEVQQVSPTSLEMEHTDPVLETEVTTVSVPEVHEVAVTQSDTSIVDEETYTPIEIATTSTTTIAESIVRIDGVPTAVDVYVVSEKELVVTCANPAITPGQHHVSMQIIVGDSIFHWEGDITWYGTVVRETVLGDMYRAYMTEDSTNHLSLLFLDMSKPGYEYTLLADDGTFSSTSPISFIDTSVTWLSYNNSILNGYDILARTMSSQLIEPSSATVVTFDSQPYEVVIDELRLTFSESTEFNEDTAITHELSF